MPSSMPMSAPTSAPWLLHCSTRGAAASHPPTPRHTRAWSSMGGWEIHREGPTLGKIRSVPGPQACCLVAVWLEVAFFPPSLVMGLPSHKVKEPPRRGGTREVETGSTREMPVSKSLSLGVVRFPDAPAPEPGSLGTEWGEGGRKASDLCYPSR